MMRKRNKWQETHSWDNRCVDCNKLIYNYATRCNHCNNKWEKNPRYVANYRYKDKRGFIHIKNPEFDGHNQRYLFEHRFVMEKYLGRKLRKKETVHHLDLNAVNNDIINLLLFSNYKTHSTFHSMAYKYLIDKFGVEEIKSYLKWFKKKGFKV